MELNAATPAVEWTEARHNTVGRSSEKTTYTVPLVFSCFFILLLKWQNKLPYRREIQKCYYVQYALFDQLCLDGVREGWRGGVVLEGEKEREGGGEGEGGWEV